MPEIRKSLTELQFKLLVDAQLKYNQILSEFQSAEKRLVEVQSLVLDSTGLSDIGEFVIDASTRELVVRISDEQKA